MALIVDKHRPRSLDELTYHDELSERLRSLVCTRATEERGTLADVRCRPKAEISPIFLSTGRPARERRHASWLR